MGRNRKDRLKITATVKSQTADMLTMFLTYIEGDIDSFMLDGLIMTPNEHDYKNVG
ncbi:hypothetical protein SAMN05216191_119104 [Paenibacillus jilunlii]|uniref:Uncharacterized protein n=1 Tax=Paenibacillus jilunlii TaxID=682956 RepID=A0A1G9WJV6_9BACL|nr:hypothetical protein SAMN05216191_119104 [Paenibacillus jilunlii]